MTLRIRLARIVGRLRDRLYWVSDKLDDIAIWLEWGPPRRNDVDNLGAWVAQLAEHEAAIAGVSSTRDVEHGAHVDQHLADPKGGPH